MSDEEKKKGGKYRDPELAINRVYTRKGDRGQTRLVGGQKVSKAAPRIEAYGTLDELNAVLGMARQTIAEEHGDNEEMAGLSRELLRVQHELFNLGSILACLPEDVMEQMPRVTEGDVQALERSIDVHNEALPPLRSFVLPGGSRLNAELHLGRTVCRRAERLIVAAYEGGEAIDEVSIAYVNRLSDALFVWSRWASVAAGAEEVLWSPNVAASAGASDED